jgi:hypothetical protein
MVVVREKMSWPHAQLACKASGGHLASVRSDAENEQLIGLADTKEPVWIGGNDLLNDGEWKWTDGTPMDYKSGEENANWQ